MQTGFHPASRQPTTLTNHSHCPIIEQFFTVYEKSYHVKQFHESEKTLRGINLQITLQTMFDFSAKRSALKVVFHKLEKRFYAVFLSGSIQKVSAQIYFKVERKYLWNEFEWNNTHREGWREWQKQQQFFKTMNDPTCVCPRLAFWLTFFGINDMVKQFI